MRKTACVAGVEWLGVVLCVLALSGCVTAYVDDSLHEIQPSEYRHPSSPQPVQFIFVFKSKGVANSRATDLLKEDVQKTVEQSGLFASAGPEPAPGGTLLSITIDNVPITSEQEAMSKGFATGLTFGLAGSTVTDGYICTLEYVRGAQSPKITKVLHHAIYGNMGAKSAPPNATKASSLTEAAEIMSRQVVGNALKQLSEDPAFSEPASVNASPQS